jgi:hypothetical protein
MLAQKRHFCGPSLAVAALGASPDRLLKYLEWIGLLFESLVISDLLPLDGRWDAIELKLGVAQIDAAARRLLHLREQIDLQGSVESVFLAVV